MPRLGRCTPLAGDAFLAEDPRQVQLEGAACPGFSTLQGGLRQGQERFHRCARSADWIERETEQCPRALRLLKRRGAPAERGKAALVAGPTGKAAVVINKDRHGVLVVACEAQRPMAPWVLLLDQQLGRDREC